MPRTVVGRTVQGRPIYSTRPSQTNSGRTVVGTTSQGRPIYSTVKRTVTAKGVVIGRTVERFKFTALVGALVSFSQIAVQLSRQEPDLGRSQTGPPGKPSLLIVLDIH